MMKGIELIGKAVRVANDAHIVRVPLKTGETALVQLNQKAQELDCLVLNKGKIIKTENIKGKNMSEGVFDEYIAGFADKLEPMMKENNINKFLHEIIKKAIK